MLIWLSENIGTILVLAILIAIVAAIIVSMRKDKKSGKLTCGGNCGECSACSACQRKH